MEAGYPLKASSILLRRHAELAYEGAPQTVYRAEAASLGDSFRGKVGFLDLASGRVETNPFDIFARSFAKLFNKQAPKISLAHPDAGRQNLRAKVF